ncbi:LytR/AlgR family response regulator transcription factor [Streptomyces tricolor]|uniref:LytR/AlgR family response regulator transcription factor n=1 Tax=Streptomyces tricolor TaxID=68277 RepID=UPI003D74F8D9
MGVTDVPLRVLAVDDEEPALAELLYLLGEDPRVGTVVPALSATEALRRLRRAMAQGPDGTDGTDGFDVVFLDIDMPGLGGLQMARLLGDFAAPPLIVFVTAYEDFAVRAFDLKAVDYLLKPLRKERFAEAVRRVAELVRAGQGPRPAAPAAAGPAASALGDQVPVELGGVTRFVPLADIAYVEAQGDYARLHTGHGSHLVRIPLSTLEEQWRSRGFVRIHRSRLVALGRIEELRVDGGNLTVRIGDRILAVSRRNARELRDLLAGRATGRMR